MFIKKVIWLLAGRWVTNIVTLIFFILIIKEIGKESYGLFVLGATFLILLEKAFAEGIEVLVIRQKGNDFSVVNSAILIALLYTIFFAFFIAISAYFWFFLYRNEKIFFLVLAICPLIVFYAVGAVYRGYLIRVGRTKHIAIIQSVICIFSAILSYQTAILGGGHWSLLVQQSLVAIMSSIIFFFISKHPKNVSLDKKLFKDMINFSVKSTFSASLNVVTNRLDVLVIGVVFGFSGVGIYSFAKRVIQIVQDIFSSSFDKVLISFRRNVSEQEEDKFSLSLSIFWQSIIIFPAFSGLALLADDILDILFSNSWVDASTMVVAMSVGGIFGSMVTLERAVQLSGGQIGKIIFVRFQELILSVILLSPIIFIPNISILYVAIAFSIRQFIGYLLVVYSRNGKNIFYHLKQVFKNILVPLISAFTMVCVYCFLTGLLPSEGYLKIFSGVLLCGLVYVVMLTSLSRLWYAKYSISTYS